MVGNSWACVPSVLKRYSTDVAEKPHIQLYGNICFDPFLPDHPNWIPSQGMGQTLQIYLHYSLYLFIFQYSNT